MIVALAMTIVSMPILPAQAAIVGTDQALGSTENAREKVADFLARQDVRDEIVRLGVSPGEAQARVNALSDEEVARIAGKIDSLPAGEGIGGIIGAVVLVFLILLLTDLLGLTDVFGFTKKGSLNPN
jgi:hypothetical protein